MFMMSVPFEMSGGVKPGPVDVVAAWPVPDTEFSGPWIEWAADPTTLINGPLQVTGCGLRF
ncbi:hypothetical protein [Streptomyces sp. Caat 7-52]|uniref:hypothetical protein n=1 Tax=Streptomyces sp. Caat 7-52 TaxID=2949637 RepID=UPI002034C694|nr:hypothetical protein [Streptomyces sp. Caat 7-52]